VTETSPTQPKIGPAKAGDIEYRAFARDFSGQVVVSVVATSSYPEGPYEIFFELRDGDLWLMQKTPVDHFGLVTYQVACWTFQPQGGTPTETTVTDAYGAHTVAVEAWSSQS
jgi:hypothetical protein